MLKRGFKSWCEKAALSYRQQLSLNKMSPLCPFIFAGHLNVKILSPKEIPDLSEDIIHTLLKKETKSWSAVTLTLNNRHIVVYNSAHSKSRQSNDLMHELSHIILDHKPYTHYSEDTEIFIRQYDDTQEIEADTFASILLLPKDILMNIKFGRKDIDLASKEYGVSPALLKMRLNTSGVNFIHKKSNY